jgi:hypothetical protein
MPEPMTCRHCDDVIGTYEPMVLVTDGCPRTTSVAAEPHISSEPGERFHRACYSEQACEAQALGS